MRANKYCYEKQKEFYSDFNTLYVQDMKHYNGFVYKLYSPKEEYIRQLLEHPFNQEVLDRNYTVDILRDLKTKLLPFISKTIKKVALTIKALKKLTGLPDYDQSLLKQQMDATEKLHLLLVMYRLDLLTPMAKELQQLLNSSDRVSKMEISSQQLAGIENIMESTIGSMGRRNNSLDNLFTAPPGKYGHPLLVEQVLEEVRSTVQQIRLLGSMNNKMILLVRRWKKNREVHEQQEILN
ncbi:hypothetical protein [Pseudoflavitalea rhizosphaerae]|uniref:hypothetical protein n=1 Tax=Pseudoflavitalea rhizosphaerae TaxID=1884793 RepID=UPI000F8F518C|nr:hypothetical protein [Pseudoflavitalea rhizosphaerae]